MEPAAESAALLPQPPKEACMAWIEAAKEGDVRELHLLLQQFRGLLNYQPPSGLRCSALHWAAARGHTDALQGLLLWGADPCVLTCTSSSPLHSAAASNRLDCVELLLLVPAVLQQLDWALSSSEEEDDHIPGSSSSSPRSRESEDAALPTAVEDSSSLLGDQLAAAETGQASQQQQQQQQQQGGAAVIDRQLGRSWLDAARAGDLRLLQALVAAHPQLLPYCGLGTSYALIGNSALHWCAAKGHVQCMEWLLQTGALQVSSLLNQADATALHTAAEHGQAVAAQLLVVRAAADVQQLDGLGQSAVQAAAGAGHQALAQQLLLWELAAQMAGTDRSSWPVSSMQKVLRLAGRASDAAACVERHELVAAAADVVHKTMQSRA
ncbi:hypothetical protein OEZ85_012019 [Tetradesmus obliquus]|uniref:Uncharacterized protein n=1 Tax=Tetradesmus obliquus TaxID=3088 RepID=A0ABY8TSF5_TETOB|nr:hypothetical protein OEZ85_012019 [Tetradesmus obliquus]